MTGAVSRRRLPVGPTHGNHRQDQRHASSRPSATSTDDPDTRREGQLEERKAEAKDERARAEERVEKREERDLSVSSEPSSSPTPAIRRRARRAPRPTTRPTATSRRCASSRRTGGEPPGSEDDKATGNPDTCSERPASGGPIRV